jgi:hypothetical protein
VVLNERLNRVFVFLTVTNQWAILRIADLSTLFMPKIAWCTLNHYCRLLIGDDILILLPISHPNLLYNMLISFKSFDSAYSSLSPNLNLNSMLVRGSLTWLAQVLVVKCERLMIVTETLLPWVALDLILRICLYIDWLW